MSDDGGHYFVRRIPNNMKSTNMDKAKPEREVRQ